MNKHIAGSGRIPAGEYESIHISGSGTLSGLVRCESFSTSGSSKGDSIDCKTTFKISGASTFMKDISAQSVGVSGSFTCGGNIKAKDRVSASGVIKCSSNVKCAELNVSGQMTVGGEIEAENVKVSGQLDCDGLVNAEEVTIKGAGSTIGAIGGSRIVLRRGDILKSMTKIPIIGTIAKTVSGKIKVTGSIEGDEITLENVDAARVSGRIVSIGDDCCIDLVQYSEEVTISEKARVKKTEKI